jgi:hypothetical protein
VGSRGDEYPQLTQAENGQVVFLDEALNLTDYEGNVIKWKKDDKTGSYSAQGPDTEFNIYAYSFQPERQKVTVTVTKTIKSEKEIAKAKAKINDTEAPKSSSKDEQKALKDAEEVAKYAPNEKTKKEAQVISKTY